MGGYQTWHDALHDHQVECFASKNGMAADLVWNTAIARRRAGPMLSARLLSDLQSPQSANGVADRLRQLTERQTEILRLVAEGLSNKEVALRLELQEKTVKHHMTGGCRNSMCETAPKRLSRCASSATGKGPLEKAALRDLRRTTRK